MDFAYHFLKNVTIRAEIAVALYMSAWIEMQSQRHIHPHPAVALYMSAWIEILKRHNIPSQAHRRTLHECVD